VAQQYNGENSENEEISKMKYENEKRREEENEMKMRRRKISSS
jgi:hypothetical protein